MRLFLVILLSLTSVLAAKRAHRQAPNIIFIYADDLGWNDVSFHGSPEIPTPNIDAMALSGITLNNYYGEWLCTPSRGALMTGKYPIRLGLQHFIIKESEASGLPLNETTLPQQLKRLGYGTHMIGKWHLGYQSFEYTPTYRGFDSFFGYYNGFLDYYDYTYLGIPQSGLPCFYGIDLHNGTKVVTNFRGQYATTVFGKHAKEIILRHDTSKPLFLYLSHMAVHTGNTFNPLQAPPEIVSRFSYIKDENRRVFAAMMSALDDTVGSVFEALHQRGMLGNTVVVFASDNGGEKNPSWDGSASNYPFRGKKMTYWEGGIRLPAVIWSPLFKLSQPRISKQLFHVSDWLPTLYRVAGGDPDDLGDIDGLDMWETLVDDLSSPRTHLLQNLDPIDGTSAFRNGDLKVVNGTTGEGFDSWYGPTGFEYMNPPSMYHWVFKNGSTVKDTLMKSGYWLPNNPDEYYQGARVSCEQPPPATALNCHPTVKPCLFNVTADPCEYNDLADLYPETVSSMMEIIYGYQKVSMKPQSKPSDPLGNPTLHHFTFVPWLDSEECTLCQHQLP